MQKQRLSYHRTSNSKTVHHYRKFNAETKILIETNRGTPACVNENSVERLENKGFVKVDVVSVAELETNTVNTESNIIDEEQNMDTLKNIPTGDITFSNNDIQSGFTTGELGIIDFWPKYTIAYPSTAQVGVPFDVVYDYSYVIPDDSLPYNSLIDLSAVYDDSTVTLSWTDSDNIGENRYRVERSVNDGDYVLTNLTPRFDTETLDDIESDWDTVSYKVFERLGKQKLYSNEISINLR